MRKRRLRLDSDMQNSPADAEAVPALLGHWMVCIIEARVGDAVESHALSEFCSSSYFPNTSGDTCSRKDARHSLADS